ncbi:MAG: hypothetical protein V1886_03170 [archaeon]
MQKIETKSSREKKQRRNQIIIGIALVSIMLLSTLGYSIMDRNSGQSQGEIKLYNNFKFLSSAGLWKIQNQDFSLSTRYLPQDVLNISYSAALSPEFFAGKEVYFSALSAETRLAVNELDGNLPALRAQFACTVEQENMTECSALPVKTCKDNLIIITAQENKSEFLPSRIYSKENCIYIEAESKNLIRAADRLLFGVYKIM